jgi:hypothetical protein
MLLEEGALGHGEGDGGVDDVIGTPADEGAQVTCPHVRAGSLI